MPDTSSARETETISKEELWKIKLLMNPSSVPIHLAGKPLEVTEITQHYVKLKLTVADSMTIYQTSKLCIGDAVVELKDIDQMPVFMAPGDTVSFTVYFA